MRRGIIKDQKLFVENNDGGRQYYETGFPVPEYVREGSVFLGLKWAIKYDNNIKKRYSTIEFLPDFIKIK